MDEVSRDLLDFARLVGTTAAPFLGRIVVSHIWQAQEFAGVIAHVGRQFLVVTASQIIWLELDAKLDSL